MQAYINFIDIYPKLINLTYKGSKGFHTYIGAFLSVCTYVLFLLAFLTMGNDMMFRKNPNILSQTFKQEHRQKIFFGKNNYTFSFVFTNDTNHLEIPPSFLTFEAGYQLKDSEGVSYKQIPITQCNESHYKGFEDLFQYQNPDYKITTCLDQETLELSGF